MFVFDMSLLLRHRLGKSHENKFTQAKLNPAKSVPFIISLCTFKLWIAKYEPGSCIRYCIHATGGMT
jgi:hypothetical protein